MASNDLKSCTHRHDEQSNHLDATEVPEDTKTEAADLAFCGEGEDG
jgi:hypothetical protein